MDYKTLIEQKSHKQMTKPCQQCSHDAYRLVLLVGRKKGIAMGDVKSIYGRPAVGAILYV